MTTKEQALKTRIDEFIGYDAPLALRKIERLFDAMCPVTAILEMEDLLDKAKDHAQDCDDLQKLQQG